MNEQNVLYSYDGILFSNRKEWRTDAYYNMNGPLKLYAKWKKSVKKE